MSVFSEQVKFEYVELYKYGRGHGGTVGNILNSHLWVVGSNLDQIVNGKVC